MEVININSRSVVADIQNEFNARYPFLQINFFKKSFNKIISKSDKIESGTNLEQFLKLNAKNIVDISSNRTCTEVVNDFEQLLELSFNLSRKSGNVWNEISLTKRWTLKNQNAAGEFISSEMERP